MSESSTCIYLRFQKIPPDFCVRSGSGGEIGGATERGGRNINCNWDVISERRVIKYKHHFKKIMKSGVFNKQGESP